MPGYIHTCSGCGAYMQVHERYLGRTLKCTSCRTEFLAELPADAEVAEEAAPVVVEIPKRSRRNYLLWILVLIPLAAIVWWLGQEDSGGVLLRADRSPGEIGFVGTDGDGPVIAAMDYDTVAVLVQAGSDSDPALVQSLVKEGHCIELSRETQVRVLERTDKGKVSRVRVLDGPWATRIVWIPARWIR